MYRILSTCKGGGYTYCRTEPIHPKANSKGLYPLHRVVMENKLGRTLLDGEDVHHKDENKFNNDPDNLEVLSKSDHSKKHSHVLESIKLTCESCKKEFEVKPHFLRLRQKRNKSGKVFCSRSCSTKMTYKKK